MVVASGCLQVLGVMGASRPRLFHSLQADGEEEPMFQLRSWVSSRQAPLSPGTTSRVQSAAGLLFSAAVSVMPL